MTIKTQLHTPVCRIRVYKSGEQEREPIEIVGQSSPEDSLISCTTRKDISNMAGAFQFSLTTRKVQYEGKWRLWNDILEPLDMVIISMYRPPQKEHVLMIGLISKVTEGFRMDKDGRPERDISVSGYDLGKLLEEINIKYFPGIVLKDTVMNFDLLRWTIKSGSNNLYSKGTVASILHKVIEDYFFELMSIRTNIEGQVKVIKDLFNYRLMECPYETVRDLTLLSEEGNITHFIRRVAERPFVEAFCDTKSDIFGTIRPDKVDPTYGVNGSATSFTAALITIPAGTLPKGTGRYYIGFGEYPFVSIYKTPFMGFFNDECIIAIIEKPTGVGSISKNDISKNGCTINIWNPNYDGGEIKIRAIGDRIDKSISIKDSSNLNPFKDSRFFLFVRPTPFICRPGIVHNNSNGDDLWNELATHNINPFDLAFFELSRHDEEIYNWFMAYPAVMYFSTNDIIGKAMTVPNVNLASTKKYGIKILEVKSIFNELGKVNPKKRNGNNMTAQLRDYYNDNDLFKSGSIVIEKTDQSEFHIGEKLNLFDEADEVLMEQYYIEGVSHNFTNFQRFLTTLTVTRGMDMVKARLHDPVKFTPAYYKSLKNDFYEVDPYAPKNTSKVTLSKGGNAGGKGSDGKPDRRGVTAENLHGYDLMKNGYKKGDLIKFNSIVWEAIRDIPKASGTTQVNQRLQNGDWKQVGKIIYDAKTKKHSIKWG